MRIGEQRGDVVFVGLGREGEYVFRVIETGEQVVRSPDGSPLGEEPSLEDAAPGNDDAGQLEDDEEE